LSDSGRSQGETPDLIKINDEVAEKMDRNHTAIKDGANKLSEQYPGIYNINQVCEIYDRLAGGGWDYDYDVNVIDRINYANETLLLAMERDVVVVGDCEDFAILMASLIESIEGSARVTFAYVLDGNDVLQGGHAYVEVYLGEEVDPYVTELINWLKNYYNVDEINCNITNGEVWLNLDCRYTSRNHPGEPYGPYLEGDEIVRREIVFEPDIKRSPRIIPLIDSMNSEEGWRQDSSTGSSIEISPVEVRSARGIEQSALEISYNLSERGQVEITKKIGPKDLSDLRGLRLSYKGDGAPNTIELRMVYADGTTFGTSWISATDTDNDWMSQDVLWSSPNSLYRQFYCLEPKGKCEYYKNGLYDPNNISEMKFIISNNPDEGDLAGRGTLIIDRVQGLMVISDTIWVEIEKDRQRAVAQNLNQHAESILNQHGDLLPLSVLLTIESLRLYPYWGNMRTIYDELALLPYPVSCLTHDNDVEEVAFSLDGIYAATVDLKGTARLWHIANGGEIYHINDTFIETIAFSPDGKHFVTGGLGPNVHVRDVLTGEESMEINLSRYGEEHVAFSSEVKALVFSPDGKYIATAEKVLLMTGFEGLLGIWNAKTGKNIVTMVHEDEVSSIDFSPDGKYLASAGHDKTARLWDIETGEEVARVNHDSSVSDVAFSPDGRYLATASEFAVQVWDLTNDRNNFKTITHENFVNAVKFSPDGRCLATASDDNTARIWELSDGQEVARIVHENRISSLDFSSDGDYIITASDDDTARIWETTGWGGLTSMKEKFGWVTWADFGGDGRYLATAGGPLVQVWDLENSCRAEEIMYAYDISVVDGLVFSPGGKYLAVAYLDKKLIIYDIDAGQEVARTNYVGYLMNLVFSHDDKYLATANSDRAVCIWNASTGEEIAKLEHEWWLVSDFTFSLDGKTLATSSDDKTARIWNASTGEEIAKLEHDDVVNQMVFSPDDTKLATASYDYTVRIWDTLTGEVRAKLKHGGWVNQIAFSPDSTKLATASNDYTARIWDASTGEEIAKLEHECWQGSVLDVEFSPDGAFLATRSDDNIARIWDASTGEEIARLEHPDRVNQVIFSPCGAILATASNATVRFEDASTGEELARLEHSDRVNQFIFSPCGATLATTSNATVYLWDVSTAEEIARLKHSDLVNDFSFSHDGAILATASNDKTGRIWNVSTGTEIARLENGGSVNDVAFSCDGATLATASDDFTARIWNASNGKEIARLEHDESVFKVAFCPDGVTLATASGGNVTRVLEADTGKEVSKISHEKSVVAISFNPDGTRLTTADRDGTANMWEVKTGDQLASINQNATGDVALSSDGRYLATVYYNEYDLNNLNLSALEWESYWVEVREVATNREMVWIPTEGYVVSLAFSRDGKYLAASSFTDAIVSEVDGGREVAKMTHKAYIMTVALSPDGKYLATTSQDNCARIWDVTNGQEVATLRHGTTLRGTEFSSDGRYLATLDYDGGLKIWPRHTEDIISEACARLNRNLTPAEWMRYMGDDLYNSACQDVCKPEYNFTVPNVTVHVLEATPIVVKPGENITLSFSNAPGNDGDWISIYPTDEKSENFGEFYYLNGATDGKLTFTAPPSEGFYHFRLFPNWPSGGYDEIAMSNIVSVSID
jgi:WD40 repeat protein